jgi:hypothetical protein
MIAAFRKYRAIAGANALYFPSPRANFNTMSGEMQAEKERLY